MGHMQMYDVDGWRMHRCIHNIDSELTAVQTAAPTLGVASYSLKHSNTAILALL